MLGNNEYTKTCFQQLRGHKKSFQQDVRVILTRSTYAHGKKTHNDPRKSSEKKFQP